MPRINNILPLPGISELEALAQEFLNHLKDVEFERDKRAALARRLQCLVDHAKTLGIPAGLIRVVIQLLEIQARFQAAGTSGSRLGIRNSQRKLAIWDDLSARLDEIMEMNILSLTQTQQTQTQQAQTEQLTQMNKAITGSLRQRVKVIDGYRVTNQVEIRRGSVCKPEFNLSTQRYETVRTTLRAGQLGNLSVAYITFAADSWNVAHEFVEQELDHISRSLHMNIAQLVGVTESYHGLNGIIVAMDGVDFEYFDLTRRSGAVWAKCIQGFVDFATSYPELEGVQRITVAPDGHVTMFPHGSALHEIESLPSRLNDWYHLDGDVAVSLLFDIYRANCFPIIASNLRLFIESLSKLGLAFTELQVMRLASSFRLFPPGKQHDFTQRYGRISQIPLGICEFGRILYREDEIEDWESLGFSHTIRDVIEYPAELNGGESMAPNEDSWWIYNLHRSTTENEEYSFANTWYTEAWSSPDYLWEDIFRESQELSENLDIDPDCITLCRWIFFSVILHKPNGITRDDIPATLYYHRRLRSTNPRELEGFVSATKVPDSAQWENSLKQQGWDFTFLIRFSTYSMRDDWGRQYERELQKSMAATPGSYPAARIEEIL
ncbi:hypothetical protein BDV93DRAFT_549489 [Ceratobasidium sp. AG-I]|nr:hypothetical protein BDV93DRAFT_549489 [Ceratobasidium sp. AG-I]